VCDVIWNAESEYKTYMDIGKSVRKKQKNVKLPLYMNIDIWRSGGVTPLILNLGTIWR
jgi:hypothetical protein